MNKSLQISRSGTINKIETRQNDHYAMMLIFQKNADKGGGGGKNWQKFADVLYGWTRSYASVISKIS